MNRLPADDSHEITKLVFFEKLKKKKNFKMSSAVDVIGALRVKTLIIKYCIYADIFAEKNESSFCICKSYSHFFSKNTCELNIILTRTVNILTTNELVQLAML